MENEDERKFNERGSEEALNMARRSDLQSFFSNFSQKDKQVSKKRSLIIGLSLQKGGYQIQLLFPSLIVNSSSFINQQSYLLNKLILYLLLKCMIPQIEAVVCLCGNDGTGKSTLTQLLRELCPRYFVVERSSKQILPSLESIRKQIKHLDLLTYRYAFEIQRQEFQPSKQIRVDQNKDVPVHWILLDLSPTQIFNRIKLREEMSIYQSKKCVEYYSFVYRELAAYYGMTVIDATPSPNQIATKIIEFIQSGATEEIRCLNLKRLTLKDIDEKRICAQVMQSLPQEMVEGIIKANVLKEIKDENAARQFFYPQIQQLLYRDGKLEGILGKQMAARWVSNHHIPSLDDNGQFCIQFATGNLQKKVKLASPSFAFFTEGESKLIYKVYSKISQVDQYFAKRVWIILKSTIYSHTHQHTGEIEHLGQIRAIGSNLFLQMLRRNNLSHAYIAINNQGIIFSKQVQTNALQVVFKREFVGTDKHSYFGLDGEEELVTQNKQLRNGIYVRFDWRNPNHVLEGHPRYVINQHPYYYIIEKAIGKQTFFERFLKKHQVKPMGDKCISEDLIKNYVETAQIKKAVLSLYCSFAYYCRRVSLQIIDGCFMFNKEGSVVWSEINPDCMRVKKIQSGQQREDYDKDIWRIGGSSSKDKIVKKWTLFNKLLMNYFLNNRFHQTQLLNTCPLSYPRNEQALRFLQNKQILLSPQYQSYFRDISSHTQKVREVIATIDINQGKPTLVKSSKVSEHHSNNSLESAYRSISVLPKIVIVDLDAAMGKQINNRSSIRELRRHGANNVYGVGGGIRSLESLNYYLNELSIPRAIISSNLELLDQIPLQIIEKRIIVQLSINEKNEILTHGRTVNTGQNIINKLVELCRKGVKIVSLTFHHKEGHLSGIPKEQFRDIMFCIPGPIEKVIIAGGISSVEDLELIWSYPKTVPQLGSALWKNKIAVPQLLCSIAQFNSQGLCPAIITSQSGKVLGQVYLNRQALIITAEQRELYRYSREMKRLIKKGESSGNTQRVVSIKLDCDQDCLNIIVEESSKPFCHHNSKSCFDFQSQHQIESVEALQYHIWNKKDSGSGYSKKMQENEHFAASKFMEESFQFITTKTRFAEEGADTIAHLLMYLNAKHVSIKTIMAELNFRANRNGALYNLAEKKDKQPRTVQYIAIMGSKYHQRLDKAALSLVGLKIVRPKNRSLEIEMLVEDKERYTQYFDGANIKPIVIKSKDMSLLLAKKQTKWCFNYSIMMENYPKIWKELAKEPIPAIRLVVLKKRDRKVDPFSWTKHAKGKVVSEYPISMINYLTELGIDEENFTLFRVSGGTEGYLQSELFDYCDAIVETGRTLQDNNLQIVKVLCNQVYGALYTLQ